MANIALFVTLATYIWLLTQAVGASVRFRFNRLTRKGVTR